MLVAGARDELGVVEHDGRQQAADRALRQRGARVGHPIGDRAEGDPDGVAVVGPHDGVEAHRFPVEPEPEIELRAPGRQPVARDGPAVRWLVDMQPRRQLIDRRRGEVGAPAGKRGQGGGVDADDVDAAAGSRGAALPEDRDRRDIRPELRVAIDRHDRRRDRERGPELGHPQVEPGPVGGGVLDPRTKRRGPAGREDDRPDAERQQREGRGRASRVT
jgi:hypothetical protein